MGLAPPPYVYDDFFTDLTKRLADVVPCNGCDVRYLRDTAASATLSHPAPIGNSELPAAFNLYHRSSKGAYMWTVKLLLLSHLIFVIIVILRYGYRKLFRPRAAAESPPARLEPTRIIQSPATGGHPVLRRRRQEYPAAEQPLYNLEDASCEWEYDDSLVSKSIQSHIHEHLDGSAPPETEVYIAQLPCDQTPTLAAQPKPQKISKWEHFFQELRKKRETVDTRQKHSSPDPHRVRGQGVYDLEQLKPSDTSVPEPVDKVTLGDGIHLRGTTFHSPTAGDVLAVSRMCTAEWEKKAAKAKKPKGGDAPFGLAQAGARLAAASGGSVMKMPLIERSDAKGDIWMPQAPQDEVGRA